MLEKVYVVTLYKRDDLENFYHEMAKKNIRLEKRRTISRNTNYYLTEEQATELREDSRVWGVELADSFKVKSNVVNREPYDVSGDFWKADTQGSSTVSPNDRQWGHYHCVADAPRGKNEYGPINQGYDYELLEDTTVTVFNNGRNVDVVIVDDPISFDSEEWYSPTSNQSRFVQYQWFNELNTLVNSIDDDSQSEPTGTITYHQNGSLSRFHGNHVCGTVAGQHYGWAREANIYNIAITATWASGQQIQPLLIFDYLRAFHRSKPINSQTGRRNPTITNHSYSGITYMPNQSNLSFNDLTSVTYRGVTYNSSNPPSGGWNQNTVQSDFGVRFNLADYPTYSASIAADVQDAIEEGIIVVGSAGNDNLQIADVNDSDWSNTINVSGVGTIYYNRGGWPNTPDAGGVITGALSKQGDFRRSTYSNFGPGVTVFSPGDNILSAYGNSGGLNDTKYSEGSGNYFYPIQGTSMASPQVCGIIACVASASGKSRFNQPNAFEYLSKFSELNDMTFDVGNGTYSDNTCQKGSPNKYVLAQSPRSSVGYIKDVDGSRNVSGYTYPRSNRIFSEAPASTSIDISLQVTNSGASDYVFDGADRKSVHTNANDVTIECYEGDTLIFNVNAGGHPFWIKTNQSTGTGSGVTTGTISGQGSQNGTVTWNTTGVVEGTYYYICQYHGGMVGEIKVTYQY